MIPVKVQEPDNDDTEKSSSSSLGDVLGLGNYVSDDEKYDDRDGEIPSSNLQGSKTKFNIEPSSAKRTLRDMEDVVGNASTQEHFIKHSGTHVISHTNDGSTTSVNETSKSTGFNKLNGDWVDEEMGPEHSLKASFKGKDNEPKLGDGTASGTKDILGIVSEQHANNVNGKKGSKDPQDGKTKIKPHNADKQESIRTSEKTNENHRKQDSRHLRKEESDDQNVQKEKLKDQGAKSGEKGKDSDSRHRSSHHNSKEERREDKHLRASTKDGTDRKREHTKDEEGRTRQKNSSDSSRHKSSKDRNKDKAVDHLTNSSDDSDHPKRYF